MKRLVDNDAERSYNETVARVSLALLGGFQATLGGAPLTTRLWTKTQALLAYLAVEANVPHRREALAGLLWPDQREIAARASLRQALHQLQRAFPNARPRILLITPRTLQFNIASHLTLDTRAFEDLFRACESHTHRHMESCCACVERLQRAALLYRGAFLADFFVKDSAPFEEWAAMQRERFEQMALAAFHHLAEYHARRRELDGMERAARRQIEINGFREDAHRQLMSALAWNGKQNAALAHYHAYCRELAEAMGAEPQAETTLLYEHIKAAALELPLLAPLRNFLTPSTPFFGREQELALLAEYLQRPEARLLTVVAPGGTGKTRLVLQAVVQNVFLFHEGACFVPLNGVGDLNAVVRSIANALGFVFSGAFDPRKQLVSYLRDQELLLVLDGLEEFVAAAWRRQASAFLEDILRSCPGVKILITSRIPLDVDGEWLVSLEGLAVPDRWSRSTAGTNPAVQLFLYRARQVNPGYEPGEWHHPDLVRICHLVEGMPLALELAATWANMMSCGEIAREIERNLDFLSTPLSNVPERHRSVRAAFEASYGLLSDKEKEGLARLAVFRGGFTRYASERVAEVDIDLLSALVHKSLVHTSWPQRYDLHELLRQYAEDKLSSAAGEKERIQDLYCDYYLSEFLPGLEQKLRGGKQNEAFVQFKEELLNVRAAWRLAAVKGLANQLGRSLLCLSLIYDLNGYFAEGEEDFCSAVEGLGGSKSISERLGEDALVPAAALCTQGLFLTRLGRYEKARDVLETSQSRLDPARYGARWETGLAPFFLGILSLSEGKPFLARDHFTSALSIVRKTHDRLQTALALDYLGDVNRVLGNYREAQSSLQEGVSIHREQGDRWGIARALYALGNLHLAAGEYAEAKHAFEESLELFTALGVTIGFALDGNGLGRAACRMGEYEEARARFREALVVATRLDIVPTMLELIVGIAEFLAVASRKECAARLAVSVMDHSAAEEESKRRAKQLLGRLQRELPHPAFEAASVLGQATTCEQAVAIALKETQRRSGKSRSGTEVIS